MKPLSPRVIPIETVKKPIDMTDVIQTISKRPNPTGKYCCTMIGHIQDIPATMMIGTNICLMYAFNGKSIKFCNIYILAN